MHIIKESFIKSTQKAAVTIETLPRSYLLSRHCIFLQEKFSKLCVLFGCVAGASIPAMTV